MGVSLSFLSYSTATNSDTPNVVVIDKSRPLWQDESMGCATNLLHAARIDTPGFLTCFPGKGAPMTPTLLGEVRPVRAAAQC